MATAHLHEYEFNLPIADVAHRLPHGVLKLINVKATSTVFIHLLEQVMELVEFVLSESVLQVVLRSLLPAIVGRHVWQREVGADSEVIVPSGVLPHSHDTRYAAMQKAAFSQ